MQRSLPAIHFDLSSEKSEASPAVSINRPGDTHGEENPSPHLLHKRTHYSSPLALPRQGDELLVRGSRSVKVAYRTLTIDAEGGVGGTAGTPMRLPSLGQSHTSDLHPLPQGLPQEERSFIARPHAPV